MRKIEALIFDVSGVLIDDLATVWTANNDAYSFFGYKTISSIEEFKTRFRLPVAKFHRSNGIAEEMIDMVETKYRERYPLHQHLIRVFPEARGTLSELKSRDVKLGIASNIPKDFLAEHLHRFELSAYFGAITAQEDCDEQKPSPKPILTTLSKLNAKPGRTAYIGDMEEDMIAGKKAEVHTVAVDREGAYQPISRLKRHDPDHVIKVLDDLLQII